MSLKLLQPGVQPLGQFDGYDLDFLTLKGGEVVTFIAVSSTGTDKAASDAFDGYVNTSAAAKRPVVATVPFAGSVTRPLMLADEGTTGYGTLFGTVVGGTVGQVATGGTVLGPHTATGSGKVTVWEKPGLYAVSLDACQPASAPGNTTTGLQPTNQSLAIGDAIKVNATTSQLDPGGTFASSTVVGRFVEFVTNGSLVNTPNSLVAALNSPSGNVSSLGPRQFAFAVFYFNPPVA